MRAKKRLFFSLIALTMLPVLAGMWLILSFSVWERFGRVIALLVFVVLTLMLVFAGFGLLAMVYMIQTGKGIRVRLPLRLIVDIFYPMALRAGRFLGFSRESIQHSFVEVSNALVKTTRIRSNPEQILILIPHCLQLSECNHKITVDINNCTKCGRCQVSQLLNLADEYGVNLAVATGGGMARRIIQERRPSAVVAVACERDLTSGLQETFPLPVFGIVNQRPYGYCLNTAVDLNRISAALDFFVLGIRPHFDHQHREVAASK